MAEDAKIEIMVVDDTPHIRKILQFLLEKEGFDVILAENGEQALTLLQAHKPDLILLDVMMPKMDGFTVLQKIRDNFETRQVPVIMLTAKAESSDKIRGLRDGANDYLTKPFNNEELLLRLHNMLAANQAQRDANPLTGLPGNKAIGREWHRYVDKGVAFSFMYIDIDRFKSFNDYYGYLRGDEAISFVAKVLRESSRKIGSPGDFIGHVGGDDFVVITASSQAEAFAQLIIDTFDQGVATLHDPEDFERGYLLVKNRVGVEEKHPLITLTLALIEEAHDRYQHMAQLSDVVVELKRYGKSMNGSVVVKERRGR